MEQTTVGTQTPEASSDADPRIVSTPGTCGGKPRIAGHRITVKHIVMCHQRGGQSPDEIVSDYPSLTLSDIYAALVYYFNHEEQIDADIKADHEHWAEVERQKPVRLTERLRQRQADFTSNSLPSR
jgi:uncharacterized protein (DUF433 family)